MPTQYTSKAVLVVLDIVKRKNGHGIMAKNASSKYNSSQSYNKPHKYRVNLETELTVLEKFEFNQYKISQNLLALDGE